MLSAAVPRLDCDLDWCQNVITCFFYHARPLHKFHYNPFTTFLVMLLTDRQTDRRLDRRTDVKTDKATNKQIKATGT